MNTNTQIITLGGGCFWCLEAVYDQLEGVLDVVSGYAGGHITNPDYQSVCSGTTGHAEVVQRLRPGGAAGPLSQRRAQLLCPGLAR